MSYTVIWTKRATKQLLAIPKKQRLLIIEWINKYLNNCENPRKIEGGRALQGTKFGWRYRVGVYRILVKINDDDIEIDVIRIGHRQGVYANLPEV